MWQSSGLKVMVIVTSVMMMVMVMMVVLLMVDGGVVGDGDGDRDYSDYYVYGSCLLLASSRDRYDVNRY